MVAGTDDPNSAQRRGLGMYITRPIRPLARDLVLDVARRLGYEIVPRWRLPRLALARCLRRMFERLKIDSVIDVGANEGQFYLFLREEVGFKGQVICYEPIPALAERIRRHLASDRLLTVRQCALGAVEGQSNLNVTHSKVFSSFLTPICGGPASSDTAIEDSLSVTVHTLDQDFGDSSALATTYLKLDTQGFDLEVLKGAEKIIGRFPALQTEVSIRPFYEGMPSFQQSISAFARYGFVPADLHLVASGEHDVAYEFDCIMVRSPIPP
jgi:FkbM family methyltransferase